MKILVDLDFMPFGQYSKTRPPTRMQDVPASYFWYLWSNGMKNEVKTSPVADYISRNLEALKKEHPDGVWS